MDELMQKLPADQKKHLQLQCIKYLRENSNHLKTYFLPDEEGRKWSGRDGA